MNTSIECWACLSRRAGATCLSPLDAAPDLAKWQGRRDYAFLLTLYNSGAHVSELIALDTDQVHFGASNFLTILGKGRKQRTVPLWNKTARVLQNWFSELRAISATKAFSNARGSALLRDGVNYILQLAVQQAAATCPILASKRISPHTVCHSTAMHLLQSGVDITVIALWLGHQSIKTHSRIHRSRPRYGAEGA